MALSPNLPRITSLWQASLSAVRMPSRMEWLFLHPKASSFRKAQTFSCILCPLNSPLYLLFARTRFDCYVIWLC